MRILLTHTPDARARYYGEAALDELRRLGEVRLNPTGGLLDAGALAALARDCDVIVSDRQTPAPAELFGKLPDLVAFVRCAMDIRNVDVAAASAAGIVVTRASAGFVASVAELAVGLLVDLARGTSAAVAAYRSGRAPEIRMGVQLAGSTLGIVGCGAIGRRLAGFAAAMGMKILAFDPDPDAVPAGVERTGFESLLGRSDFVVCLAAATPQTRHMMGKAAFAAMPRGAFFVNLSRGELVDEAALLAALDAGHLAGAAVDVGMAPDQMPSPAVAAHPGVVATPHIGGLTPAAVSHQAFDTVRQVAALSRGEMPDLAVNPESAARLARLRAN
ncbi:MAG: hydroxyacid dehydrogenase [Rhodospirillales bacterium]|nr:hydroxyacid dehydrogenase [Rhodospirillales bacterium]